MPRGVYPHPRKSLATRVWPKVDCSGDGCWLWTGAIDHKGYGRIGMGAPSRFVMRAHRATWELTFGPIPEGLCVLHKCDNPPCVRPSHLFLGTISDNSQDMAAKGRSAIQRNPALIAVCLRCPNDKLRRKISREARYEIAVAYRAGARPVDLARQHGVTRSYVCWIGRTICVV